MESTEAFGPPIIGDRLTDKKAIVDAMVSRRDQLVLALRDRIEPNNRKTSAELKSLYPHATNSAISNAQSDLYMLSSPENLSSFIHIPDQISSIAAMTMGDLEVYFFENPGQIFPDIDISNGISFFGPAVLGTYPFSIDASAGMERLTGKMATRAVVTLRYIDPFKNDPPYFIIRTRTNTDRVWSTTAQRKLENFGLRVHNSPWVYNVLMKKYIENPLPGGRFVGK